MNKSNHAQLRHFAKDSDRLMKYEERERCGAVLIDTCTQVLLPRLGTPSMAASFPSPYPRHRVVPSQLTLLVFTYALTLSLKISQLDCA